MKLGRDQHFHHLASKITTLHREQVRPTYFSLHGHCPVNGSHFSLLEPN